jgi:hypothetical protein
VRSRDRSSGPELRFKAANTSCAASWHSATRRSRRAGMGTEGLLQPGRPADYFCRQYVFYKRNRPPATARAGAVRLTVGPPQSLKITPSGVGVIVSAVSSLRWKNAGMANWVTIMTSTPPTRKATAMTNGGPMPNQDVPDAELAGL